MKRQSDEAKRKAEFWSVAARSMTCWAFLRTMAQDYGHPTPTGYPWRALGPEWEPHLLYPLMEYPGVPVLFRTRKAAMAHARAQSERGRPVRVTISWPRG